MMEKNTKSEEKLDSENLSICYFGTYEKDYPRNRILIKGLQRSGFKVIECHVPLWEKSEDKTGNFLKSKKKITKDLIKSYFKLIKKYHKIKKKDILIVGYLGQFDMLLARLLAPRKKIIFNPMISLYDTMVSDRRLFKEHSFLAKLSLLIDKISCKLADIIILDTPEHARYFNKKIKVKNKKLRVIPVGIDSDIFYPIKKEKEKKMNILFYGKFTPIHGVEYILKAAKALENNKSIEFIIIGKGQTYEKDMQLYKKLKVSNIHFIDWIPYEKLPKIIANSDICLGGHFGKGKKALRVVPNKTFQMIAMKKPVIVSNSIASVEAGFQDKENCIFCRPGDEKEIIEGINLLIKNKRLSEKISKKVYELSQEKYTIERIGEKAKSIIKKI